jgi:hypothetical protein
MLFPPHLASPLVCPLAPASTAPLHHLYQPHPPEPPGLYRFQYYTLPYAVCGLAIFFLDCLFRGVYTTQPSQHDTKVWYQLHILANLVNVLCTARDFGTLLADPYADPYAQFYDAETIMNATDFVPYFPTAMVLALHVYHLAAFHNIQTIDYIHHVVMCGALLLTVYFPDLAMVNFTIFMVCGLPGLLDYILLVCVKTDRIHTNTEKWVNGKINVWLRSPGTVIAAYLVYLRTEVAIGYAVALVVVWNAQYFMERVVQNAALAWGRVPERSECIPRELNAFRSAGL